MQSLTSPKVLRELIERHGFKFSKSLGQNFLIDENILRKIVDGARIGKGDRVLEIGPGVGTMTQELARRAERVVAVEIDKALLPILSETLAEFPNVEIIHGDILKLDMARLMEEHFDKGPFKVVANLPYYITTPIIMYFLEEGLPFETMVVMIQKEVAERMNARPGTKEYGALSIGVQYYAEPRIIGRVPPTVFMPPPKVDSIIIALDRKKEPEVFVKDRRLFFRLVKAAFAQRRKTLQNALFSSGIGGIEKEQWSRILKKCNIDPSRRGESLTIREFAELANELEQINRQP